MEFYRLKLQFLKLAFLTPRTSSQGRTRLCLRNMTSGKETSLCHRAIFGFEAFGKKPTRAGPRPSLRGGSKVGLQGNEVPGEVVWRQSGWGGASSPAWSRLSKHRPAGWAQDLHRRRRAGAWPTGSLWGWALSQLLGGVFMALFTICSDFIYFSVLFLFPISATRLSAPSGRGP